MKEVTLPVTCNQLKWIALIGFPIMTIVSFINDPKILGNIIVMFGMSFTAIGWTCQLYAWFDNKWAIKCKCEKK